MVVVSLCREVLRLIRTNRRNPYYVLHCELVLAIFQSISAAVGIIVRNNASICVHVYFSFRGYVKSHSPYRPGWQCATEEQFNVTLEYAKFSLANLNKLRGADCFAGTREHEGGMASNRKARGCGECS